MLVFSAVPVFAAETASAIDDGCCGAEVESAIEWTLYDNGELIFEGTGAMQEYKLSDISRIQAPWNSYDSVKTVIIKDGITSISATAFYGSTLEELIIPDSLTLIGAEAFSDCKNLRTVTGCKKA